MQPKAEEVLKGLGVLTHLRPGHRYGTRLEALHEAAKADGPVKVAKA